MRTAELRNARYGSLGMFAGSFRRHADGKEWMLGIADPHPESV